MNIKLEDLTILRIKGKPLEQKQVKAIEAQKYTCLKRFNEIKLISEDDKADDIEFSSTMIYGNLFHSK